MDDKLLKTLIDIARSKYSFSIVGPNPRERRKLGEKEETRTDTNEKEGDLGSHTVEGVKGSKPHIVFVLMDDLGYHDVGYAEGARKDVQQATSFITKLAEEEGIILDRHYAHWHCSPSRRSFLTGRLTYHTGKSVRWLTSVVNYRVLDAEEILTDPFHDHIDLRWTWITEKLQSKGYRSWYFGKGHHGFESVKHLPRHRGFDIHTGILNGADGYRDSFAWDGFEPKSIRQYSTRYYGKQAYNAVEQHLASGDSNPFFLFLSFQTPHSPLDPPEPTEYRSESIYEDVKPRWKKLDQMMYTVDVEVKALVELLQLHGEWNNTFFAFISDNGATTSRSEGSNWPLRGEKSTSFEGALRVTGFLAGGFVPQRLYGTHNSVNSHIADWYSTFCYLAGVDPEDDPPEPARHPNLTADTISPYYPVRTNALGEEENLWGNSYPGIDSVNLVPFLYEPEKYSAGSAHEYLVLSTEVVIRGDYKLITAQPCALDTDNKRRNACKIKDNKLMYGWIKRDDVRWKSPPNNLGCLEVFNPHRYPSESQLEPCLFDLRTDPREEQPLFNPSVTGTLWKHLNNTILYQYTTTVPGKQDGLSPKGCLGICRTLRKAQNFFGIEKDRNEVPLCGLDYVQDPGALFC